MADEPTIVHAEATVLRADSSISSPSISEATGGAAGSAEVPNVLKHRFVLEDKLGSGGMGTVYRAKDLRKVEARDKQPHVAIKVLNNNFRAHPEAFVALEREASKSQTLRHSNIVSIFDFDKDGSIPFITMELLEGRELGELLKAYPAGLPDEIAWPIVEGMVAGLAHAHGEGVVHADFKPGNIFVSSENVAKVLDFGIARAMRTNQADREQDADTEFDPARLAALTPAYASREMLNGDNPEPRDDLYSLGVVVYMVFSGHHPYGRLNANDAAAEQLQPERIKRLTRRQWRALESCLTFNRQQRPDSVADLQEAFFGKAAWHSWGVVAGLASLTLALVLTSFSGSEELAQVKDEVRQTTLVDAQVARITELVQSPAFNESWSRQLASELETLQSLAPENAYHADITSAIEGIYTSEIKRRPLAGALELYGEGLRFAVLADAAQHLSAELTREAERLVKETATVDWLERVAVWLESANRHFPDDLAVGMQRLALVDALGAAMPVLSDADLTAAETAYALYAENSFDSEGLDVIADEVSSAVAQHEQDEADREFAATQARLVSELDELLAVSCLRLDVPSLGTHLRGIQEAHGMHFPAVHAQIRPRIKDCIKRLDAVDADRAQSLHREAMAHLGSWIDLEELDVDPCSLQYLVGNGRQVGRSGSCSDAIDAEHSGPRLVVIPGAENVKKFAISKYEVSRREFAAFCADTRECSELEPSDMPVSGVSVAQAVAYAKWLSTKTGYQYRLPLIDEWVHAAQGLPDPNRNCRLDAGGVTRGFRAVPANSGDANNLGVYHMLGNVQELVVVPGVQGIFFRAAGGAFADPIERCLAQTQRDAVADGDEQTGFRVVREVS